MQPFGDIDILDLTQSIAGPMATQLLGSFGAHVVKIEPPGGDAFRPLLDGAMFASVNLGGKQSLAIDLKTDEGARIARELAAEADVVVESFRPGVLEQYGLEYESVVETNQDVVYCSVTGFGQSGPRTQWPAYDPVVQAMSGLMSTIGYRDRPPVRIGASIIDCGTGMTAAFLIATALAHRSDSGEGTQIDVSLFDVAVSWMGYWIANYSGAGEVPQRSGQGFAGLAPNEVFRASEEEPFYLAVLNDRLFERLCQTINRPDLLEDDRFDDNASRWDHRDVLRDKLTETFQEWDRGELTDTLAEAGVPAGPLQTIDEVVDEDPHIEARNLLTDTYNVFRQQEVRTANLPFEVNGHRLDLGNRPPDVGEHTRTVLSDLGYASDEIERLLEAGVVVDPDESAG